jgi:hypothetical protein
LNVDTVVRASGGCAAVGETMVDAAKIIAAAKSGPVASVFIAFPFAPLHQEIGIAEMAFICWSLRSSQ